MAQLHQQHFETSQNQMKALKNITSTSSFTSTVGYIPIYDGKDKDACTKWLQKCKEASFYTGYSFRSALLKRLSQDMEKSYDPWTKISHTTSLLRRSCVPSQVYLILQQLLTNCPIYASNQVKTSSSTLTSTEISTGGVPRSYHVKRHTSSHSASSAPHSKIQ